MCLICATGNVESKIDELIEYIYVLTVEEIIEELEEIKKEINNLND